MIGHIMRNQLDLLRPELKNRIVNKQTCKVMTRSAVVPRDFLVGERVMVRDYRSQHDKWQPAIIHKCLGLLSYQVAVHGGTVVWLRHADQIRQSNFKASQEEDDDTTESEGQSRQLDRMVKI